MLYELLFEGMSSSNFSVSVKAAAAALIDLHLASFVALPGILRSNYTLKLTGR